MATLDKIKSRIKSVTATSKITKAMELVATAKIRKAKAAFDKTHEYFSEIMATVVDITSEMKQAESNFITQRPQGLTL